MSQVDKHALRRVAENATPGEWCVDESHGITLKDGVEVDEG